MLHIHNGDSAANTAKQSSVAGRHIAWRESLITGPTPAGLSATEWRRVRANHLSQAYGVEEKECERDLSTQEQMLASATQHEEVILWFEHDLYCQVHLLYLLHWFSQHDAGKTRLSLICIGEFPGIANFHGLGELNAEQLASLFPARKQLTSQELNLASLAWQNYCSENPESLADTLHADTSPLPFLRAALHAHLERFPSTRNGLGRIENRALQLINEGLNSFGDLFRSFTDAESLYGLGDAQFWLSLQRLSASQKPLLSINNGNKGGRDPCVLTPEIVKQTKLELTEFGRSVMEGAADFVVANGIDLWLGGVHLHGGNNLWRWDEQSQALVST